MTDRRRHALFRRFPIDGSTQVDGQALPTPYHVYDGTLLMLGGTADGAAASARLAGSGLAPVLDTHGRALMAAWLGDFTAASLGPHQELQFSLFASTRPLPPVPAHPFAIHRLLTTCPEARMACAALWNTCPRVARYNADHLGLDAGLALGGLAQTGGRWHWRFAEPGGPLLSVGEIDALAAPSSTETWQLLRHLGARGLWRLAHTPTLCVPVAGLGQGHAATAFTYTHSRRQTVRRWTETDRIAIQDTRCQALGFAPACVQRIEGLRFVYLRPDSISRSIECAKAKRRQC